jgi:hypothetical protein
MVTGLTSQPQLFENQMKESTTRMMMKMEHQNLLQRLQREAEEAEVEVEELLQPHQQEARKPPPLPRGVEVKKESRKRRKRRRKMFK